jgi:hypothetical protein
MLLTIAFATLARVREESIAARFALHETLRLWNAVPEIPMEARAADVTDGALRKTLANLEITYVLRLFAAFEGILRDYWESGLGRATEPPMQQLLDSVAAQRKMSPADLDAAHEVREYRNELIHEDLRVARFDMQQCVSALGSYLRWLPQSW